LATCLTIRPLSNHPAEIANTKIASEWAVIQKTLRRMRKFSIPDVCQLSHSRLLHPKSWPSFWSARDDGFIPAFCLVCLVPPVISYFSFGARFFDGVLGVDALTLACWLLCRIGETIGLRSGGLQNEAFD
jgi:hypothetical protein